MSKLQFSTAIRMGSMLVPRPWDNYMERCALGMALAANGLKPRDCGTLRIVYPWLAKIFSCQWCENCAGHEAMRVVMHTFGAHVLTGQITLDRMCDWITEIEPDPWLYGLTEDFMPQSGIPPSLRKRPKTVGNMRPIDS